MDQLFTQPAWVQALAATLFTYAMTAAGASLVFFVKNMRAKAVSAAEGMAAGVMIAAGFFSLLLPALERAEPLGAARCALIMSVGFLAGGAFIFAADRVFSRVNGLPSEKRSGALMCVAMTLHNIPEGFAVGVAFGGAGGAAFSSLMLACGIGIQNFPEGMCVSLPLRREGMPRGKAFLIGQLSGFAEVPAGVLGALAVGAVSALLPWALAFSAGAMLAVVCAELIPSAFRESKLIGTFSAMGGFALMMFLDILLG